MFRRLEGANLFRVGLGRGAFGLRNIVGLLGLFVSFGAAEYLYLDRVVLAHVSRAIQEVGVGPQVGGTSNQK